MPRADLVNRDDQNLDVSGSTGTRTNKVLCTGGGLTNLNMRVKLNRTWFSELDWVGLKRGFVASHSRRSKISLRDYRSEVWTHLRQVQFQVLGSLAATSF